MAELELGRNLRPDSIAEGNDIYFECRVRSNPAPHRFTWTHEVINMDQSFYLLYVLSPVIMMYQEKPRHIDEGKKQRGDLKVRDQRSTSRLLTEEILNLGLTVFNDCFKLKRLTFSFFLKFVSNSP